MHHEIFLLNGELHLASIEKPQRVTGVGARSINSPTGPVLASDWTDLRTVHANPRPGGQERSHHHKKSQKIVNIQESIGENTI